VKHWIHAEYEPRQLILAWQASSLEGVRWRWAVGILSRTEDGRMALRYLEEGDEFEQLNSGKKFEELLSLGYSGYPAFDRKRGVHCDGVREALMRRLPPRGRSDFASYAAQFRLADATALSDCALLARTEAKVPSDGFSIVDPLDPLVDRFDMLVEIAGFRHYAEQCPVLDIGEIVQISAEPGNIYDDNAVQITRDGVKIGNVNRLQCETFRSWLKYRRVDAVVERINGTKERPRVFLFVSVCPKQEKAAA
jgi:hypothetical protein